MLVVLRHGRTEANASGLLLGRADPSLDDVGRAQAVAAAAALPTVSRVVCSPLRRARETAAAFDRPVEVDERWIELDYGDWDQRPLVDVPAVTWAAWQADPTFRPPGGESLVELGNRVRAACTDLAAAAAVVDIAVVTHVSPVKAAVAWALGVGDEVSWRLHVALASVTRIEMRGDRAVLVAFGDVSHLVAP